MTHIELKSRIQGIICKLWNAEFTGNIIIKDLEPEGYEVGFEDHLYQPTWFSACLPDEQFLEQILEFLRCSSMFLAQRFRTERNTTVFRQNPFVH